MFRIKSTQGICLDVTDIRGSIIGIELDYISFEAIL